MSYSPENGDIFIIGDPQRQQLGYDVHGMPFTLQPNTWYIANSYLTINRGYAVGMVHSTSISNSVYIADINSVTDVIGVALTTVAPTTGTVTTAGGPSTTILMSNTSGLFVGMNLVPTTGVTAGTYITAITLNTSITVNQNATTTLSQVLTFLPGTQSCTTDNTSYTLTVANSYSLTGLMVTGINIPVNTYVVSITDGTHVIINNKAIAAVPSSSKTRKARRRTSSRIPARDSRQTDNQANWRMCPPENLLRSMDKN